jgi:hypothetical protein
MAMVRSNGWICDGVGELLEAPSECSRGSVGPGAEPTLICASAQVRAGDSLRHGAIDATIDHANGWMVSKETGDVYSTNEPQVAFSSRIAFCLNMHNEAIKAMRFPPNSHKEKESAKERRERLYQDAHVREGDLLHSMPGAAGRYRGRTHRRQTRR